MVSELRILADLWPVLLSIVGLIAWLVRLESRVNRADENNGRCEKKIDEYAVKHDALDSKVVEQLAQVRESLARIEGALGVRNN
jgi:hypothetical protein